MTLGIRLEIGLPSWDLAVTGAIFRWQGLLGTQLYVAMIPLQ